MDLDKLEKLAEDLKLGYFTFQKIGRDLSKLIAVARAAERFVNNAEVESNDPEREAITDVDTYNHIKESLAKLDK